MYVCPAGGGLPRSVPEQTCHRKLTLAPEKLKVTECHFSNRKKYALAPGILVVFGPRKTHFPSPYEIPGRMHLFFIKKHDFSKRPQV